MTDPLLYGALKAWLADRVDRLAFRLIILAGRLRR